MSSTTNSKEVTYHMAAVIENRAKEVGLALLNLNSLHLQLSQYIELSRSYINTLTQLQFYEVREVIIVSSNHEVVVGGVNRAICMYNQIPVSRGDFDDTKGFLMVQHLCYNGDDKKRATDSDCSTAQNYLAMGAAGALLKYLENEKGFAVMSKSLRLSWIDNGMYMAIDIETIQNLEVIDPLKIEEGGATRGVSLYRMMNHTKTKCGAQLLKASLLQPLVNIPTLQLRYDTVEELTKNPELALNLSQSLGNMPHDLDKVCGNLMLQPQRVSSESGQKVGRIVDAVLQLREALQLLPILAMALENVQSPLLNTMKATFQHGIFSNILTRVNDIVDEDARPSKSTVINKVNQCFSVKADSNGFLALARTSLQKITDQIHELVTKYSQKYSLQDLKTPYNAKKGFYFTCLAPGSKTQGGDTTPPLPSYFQIVGKSGRDRIQCTTAELIALNNRLKNAYNDCLLITEQVLDDLLNFLVENMKYLGQLVDNVALLDMLLSFAQLVCGDQNNFAKPNIDDLGPLVIVGGQHPLLKCLDEQKVSVQPNDTYISEAASFHIITGPNMSGKSTYLRQVASIVIMAQAGCFVPAKFCSLTPFKSLMSRIGSSDNLESNSSSFMVEMQEMAQILKHVDDKSLVIIDELGRATSTHDGIAISWAIAEKLISIGAATLFATHFQEVCELSKLYPNCTVWHFDVVIGDDTMGFTWQLKQAVPEQIVHYGLRLAPSLGIPPDVVSIADNIVLMIENEKSNQTARNPLQEIEQEEVRRIYNLADEILCVLHQWRKHEDVTKLPRGQIMNLIQDAKDLMGET